ncbi:MAG: hypothetical protein HY787_09785 [Deltaproteobacteria bacterium]|nr:hypothetical protein [Deltaproteobacteria bacterium]
MRLVLLLLISFFLFFSGTSCKEVQKRVTPSGINIMVHDIACQEVKDRLIKECKNQSFPYDWLEKEQETLLIGPLTTPPLPEDSFAKMEEKYRLEIKCMDPISTRISVQIQLKGMTADNRWLVINEPDRLNAYGQRFLERLVKP